MTQADFRYPGKGYHDFTKLLGLLANGAGNRVVVRPEQWEHSKCYGVTRLSKLQHYLEVVLYKSDGSVAFSYRDFVFGIRDNRFSNLRQECANDIVNNAKSVAARVQSLFPNVTVEVEVEENREKNQRSVHPDAREQHWTCEKCGASGSVKHEQHTDVMSVVHLIGDDHRRVSTECDQPVAYIRTVNPEFAG